MKLQSIHFRHIYHFADLKINFKHSKKPITVIIGDQASGITAFIKNIYQALSYAKEGDFTSSEEEIAKADAALLEAHNLQTQFLAQEAGGTKTEITALFVHSQDHLMTSITEINLIFNRNVGK